MSPFPRPLALLAVLLLLVAGSGATCWRPGEEILPPALAPGASLDQIIAIVNGNTARVQSLFATQATLSIPGAPTLSLNLAVEPPRRFRLRAGMGLIGPEFDLGSNDDMFWLWVRRNQPPAVYFCRHDQFAAGAGRALIPVEPTWLPEALGLAHIDPAEHPEGPFPVGAGRLQIRSIRHTALGDLHKATIVDAVRGVVLEQHLYDTGGVRLASAFASQFHRDPVSGAILPRHIEIQYPSTQLNLKIDIADMQVNVLGPQSDALWTKPEYPGYPDVDLAQASAPLPVGMVPGPAGATTVPPPGALAPPATTYAPNSFTAPPPAIPGAPPVANPLMPR